MLFKLIGNLIIAAVAFQIIPGSWTQVVYETDTNPELVMQRIIWPQNDGDDFAPANENDPQKTREHSLGVNVSASAALVADAETGKILFEKNSDVARPIASITKLMAALVFLDKEPDWDKVVSASCNNFWGPVKSRHLFYATLVASDNCAARTLPSALDMSTEEFVAAMNAKAEELGLEQTVFYEPTGLNSQNQSTALEIAKILKELISHDQAREATTSPYYDFYSQNGKYFYLKTTDDLLASFINRPPYEIIGGKTGSLAAAGYCLALAVENDGNRVIIVSLNSKTDALRFHDVKSMAHWVFRTYTWPEQTDD